MSIVDRWIYPASLASHLVETHIYDKGIIIFDIDDTLITILGQPIWPVIALYHQCIASKHPVYLITARPSFLRLFTCIQLRILGIHDYHSLIMRPSIMLNIGEYKYDTRCHLAKMGYRIYMNIGDKESDFLNGAYDHAIRPL